MSDALQDFDWSTFWEDSDYALKSYVGAPVTTAMIEALQNKYGYKLPDSYIHMLRYQNGGIPMKGACPSPPTSWSETHCGIHGIFGLDSKKPYSLFRSDFWIKEWGYPDIGLYICDCPSAGHDMIALDYSQCGSDGEPRVVHIDQESDYEITVIADDFSDFIRKLVYSEEFADELDDD